MEISNFALNDAINHSFNRKMKLGKKITPETCRKEIQMAQMTGEASGAERILALLVQMKKQPDFKLEDFEAELHMFVSDTLGCVSEYYHGVKMGSLEQVLKQHGYLKE